MLPRFSQLEDRINYGNNFCSRHEQKIATHYIGGKTKEYLCTKCANKMDDEPDTIKTYLGHYYNRAYEHLQ